MSKTEKQLPAMETKCEECDGAGGHTECGDWVDCHNCHGAGYLPTAVGKQILALMRHNLKPMLSRD